MKGRFAFVEFKSVKDAEIAIQETNGITLRGFKIHVEKTSKLPQSQY